MLQRAGYTFACTIIIMFGFSIYFTGKTERTIDDLQYQVIEAGKKARPLELDKAAMTRLPQPVQRYFSFVFQEHTPTFTVVYIEAEGDFRRPRTENFAQTSAEQVIAIGTPALMFSATTPIIPGVWARAYDFFAGGKMEMKAKILSVFTVVDERKSERLNKISLRRWLLESALYPQALLPGGPVTWDEIDANSARATVSADGLVATMIAYFDKKGRMTRMVAEEDGDLMTPYHGSGEHVIRGDYRKVGNQMIPYSFTISRAAKGEVFPFWKGHITSITFSN